MLNLLPKQLCFPHQLVRTVVSDSPYYEGSDYRIKCICPPPEPPWWRNNYRKFPLGPDPITATCFYFENIITGRNIKVCSRFFCTCSSPFFVVALEHEYMPVLLEA